MLEPPLAPLPALGLFAILALLIAICVWPRVGALPRLLRLLRRSERVLLEDALKQLHHAETAGQLATVEYLAGGLDSPRGAVVRLVERLVERGLVRAEDGHLALTPVGRAHALHMVRAHRLWERYLAESTGVQPEEWHDLAEVQEHVLSAAEAEALSARLGHPRYDPHGDPIPTATGEMPLRAGRPLSAHIPGAGLIITHLEDEPRESFERLVAQGLTPGTRIRLLGVAPAAVRYRHEGRDHTLPPVVADQITAEPLADGEQLDEAPRATLAEIPPGSSGRVVRLAASCQGPQRRRLLDLGVVPGARITTEYASPGGDPVAYRIRGALIALRRAQALLIHVDAEPARAAS